MINRDGRWMSLECDECGNESDEFDDFDEMLHDCKEDGWRVYQSQGAWKHECPDCTGSGGLARQRALFG